MTEGKLVPYEIPEGLEIYTEDGVFIKQMVLPRAGIHVPQHSHEYAHMSMLAVGSVEAYRDGELLGVFNAPTGIPIKARCMHRFVSLEPSVIYCIHNITRAGEVEIHAENAIDFSEGG